MQMARFERKCITLCIMTGIFLESSKAQAELSVGAAGGLSVLQELYMAIHYCTRARREQNSKCQSAKSHPILKQDASFGPARPRQALISGGHL